jgi:hypothetical protein
MSRRVVASVRDQRPGKSVESICFYRWNPPALSRTMKFIEVATAIRAAGLGPVAAFDSAATVAAEAGVAARAAAALEA